MKKWLLCLVIIVGYSGLCHAIRTEEMGTSKHSDAHTLSVSTSAWTEASDVNTLADRSGIRCANPATNNAAVYGIISDDGVAPSEATSVHPIEIGTGENPFIPLRNNQGLYLISGHTAAENVHCQEIGQ